MFQERCFFFIRERRSNFCTLCSTHSPLLCLVSSSHSTTTYLHFTLASRYPSSFLFIFPSFCFQFVVRSSSFIHLLCYIGTQVILHIYAPRYYNTQYIGKYVLVGTLFSQFILYSLYHRLIVNIFLLFLIIILISFISQNLQFIQLYGNQK